MPLLEVTQTRHISASIRLTDTTALQVDQYAAFIHASADDVVEQALAYVFSKDRDFQEFLRRLKRSASRRLCASVARLLPKPLKRLQSLHRKRQSQWERRHDLPSLSCPDHCGAARRKNFRYSIPHRELFSSLRELFGSGRNRTGYEIAGTYKLHAISTKGANCICQYWTPK